MSTEPAKKQSRIQKRNRGLILEAALNVFSLHGFRGATLDQLSEESGLSKPNILYYFSGKEEIHIALLNTLMHTWLDPLKAIDPKGEPIDEILRYVIRKLEMTQDFPRESRLFANEILQGAPRMAPHLEGALKALFDEKCELIADWSRAGKIAPTDPAHLIISIWATTQHYADFAAQIELLQIEDPIEGAREFLDNLYRRLLTP